MRILVVGAGAIGGYFGGRLLQAGRDVTFLVRPRRAAQLAKRGLSIRSPSGDSTCRSRRSSRKDALADPFDLVLLSCKAYDLDGAIPSFAKAVGPRTAILPLLNGMRHLDVLADRFGADHALGGLCVISATLDAEGGIVHLNDSLAYLRRARRFAVAADRSDRRRPSRAPDSMRGSATHPSGNVGEMGLYRHDRGHHLPDARRDRRHRRGRRRRLSTGLLDECAAIAASHGFPPRKPFSTAVRADASAAPGSPLTASMLRDIEHGAPSSGPILGDLLRRAGEADAHSLLRIAYAHTKAYEAQRQRRRLSATKRRKQWAGEPPSRFLPSRHSSAAEVA